jgi:hypothetical protein
VKNLQPGDLVTVCNRPLYGPNGSRIEIGDLGLIVSNVPGSIQFTVLFPSCQIQVSSYWLDPVERGK